MKIERAIRGCWVDTPCHITPAIAAWVRQAGYRGIFRYLPRWRIKDPTKPAYENWFYAISRIEVDAILGAGLELSLCTACKTTSRGNLSGDQGAYLANVALEHCAQEKIPAENGLTIWYDAEWTDKPGFAIVKSEIEGYARRLTTAGARCGTYVGYDLPSGDQWYSLRGVHSYWGSAMWIKTPQPGIERLSHAPRGWQARQGPELRLPVPGLAGGLDVDQTMVCLDDRGERFYTLVG